MKELPAQSAFDRRFLEEGKHSLFLYLPQELHTHIGAVIAYWGAFETSFDGILGSLIEADGEKIRKNKKKWRNLGFSGRCDLFKEICEDWISAEYPSEAEEYLSIIERARGASKKRNLLAHGNYSYTILAHSMSATNFRAINSRSGEFFAFDDEILIGLHHEISHLAASLIMTSRKIGDVEGNFLLIEDNYLLTLLRSTKKA